MLCRGAIDSIWIKMEILQLSVRSKKAISTASTIFNALNIYTQVRVPWDCQMKLCLVRIWNQAPDSVTEAKSVFIAKKAIKIYVKSLPL